MAKLIERIRLFLIEANQHGYGAGSKPRYSVLPNGATISVRLETDGSKTIEYTRGDWRSHDNYFGGEPYGGRTVVFYQNQAIWMMVYYGQVVSGDSKEIYKILRKALLASPDDFPIRGPASLPFDGCRYNFAWSGQISKFEAMEYIMRNGAEIYRAKFVGGLVDQPEGVVSSI
jgi:hypothetical protein